MSARPRGRVRPPRRVADRDHVDAPKAIEELMTSLTQIRTRDHSALSFETLYRISYRLVLKKHGDELYQALNDLESKWLVAKVWPQVLGSMKGTLVALSSRVAGQENADQQRIAGEHLMRTLKEIWEDHITCMGMTTDVLMYMNRVYCEEARKTTVMPLTMGLFRVHILNASVPKYLVQEKIEADFHDMPLTVLNILVAVVMSQIELDRKGDVVDKNLIRSCMYMLEGLYETNQEEEHSKLYLTVFEPEFLKRSRTFFSNEGERLLETMDAGSYCRHVQQRLREEEARCGAMLPKLTTVNILNIVETELITKCIQRVIQLESGVAFMLDNGKIDELRNIYSLVLRVDGKKQALKSAVQKRIVELGIEINKVADEALKPNPKHSSETKLPQTDGDTKPTQRPGNQQTQAAIAWVEQVLGLKDRYDEILRKAFANDSGLQTAFTVSFAEFINMFERSSEYLSLFFDENMKKGIKGKSDAEIDALVDKGIVLLRYVSDKDMFERYYKKHLGRRLILKKSASIDAEKQILVKMKMEIGNSLTSRIEPMFKDMDVSADLTIGFKKYVTGLGSTEEKSSELEINVLTNTMWPLEGLSVKQDESEEKRKWPVELEKLKSSFERFYLNKHTGRKLTFPGQLGSVELKAYFPKAMSKNKFRELSCSTYAAIILLLFNDLAEDETLTYEEIQARSDIPEGDLIRNLQSLSVADKKNRILIKEPMTRDVKPTDKFCFNAAFNTQFARVKINVVAANRAETIVERQETEKKNDESRAHVIDAAIVRIMKQRKQLAHAELITEVVHTLVSRFKPDLPMIKKRIESLIEREYLERTENSERPSYQYLA